MALRGSCLVLAVAAVAASARCPHCADAGGAVSLLQSSQKLWMPKATKAAKAAKATKAAVPAPPAESSIDEVIGVQEQYNLEDAFNYSVVENITRKSNVSNTSEEDVYMVEAIQGAKPVAVDTTNEALRDCLMGTWSEWSECMVRPKTGLKGPHQIRQRSIVQPWMPGGLPCLPQLEGRECKVKSR